jgi:phage FluMu protein Com
MLRRMIRFRCEHCRQWLTIAEPRAGATGKCPLCRQTTHVPRVSETPPPAEAGSSAGAHPMSEPPAPGDVPLELVREPSKADEHADEKVAFYCEIQGRPPATSEPEVRHNLEVAPPPRVRLIDVILYPVSFEGLVRIIIFALGWWIGGLFAALDDLLSSDARAITLIVAWHLFLVWCIALYFAHCVFDSSKRGTRAPATWAGYVYTGGDLPSMMLLGAVAFCLGSAALYGAFTRDLGLYFWILTAAGAFFLPMLLLACTLFGGTEALNLAMIVTSIRATLAAYLGLIVRLALLAAFAGLVHWDSWWLGLPRVLPYAADLYVLWIAGHLLGRFYLRQKGKLGWKL